MEKNSHSQRLIECLSCGSSWLREAVPRMWKEQDALAFQYADLPYMRSARSEPLDNLNPLILICLCGAPRRPVLSGVRFGRAEEQTDSLMEDVDGALECLADCANGQELKAAVAGRVDRGAFDAAARRLRPAEVKLLNLLKRRGSKLVVGLRKPWKQIARRRETKSVGKDHLALGLQQAGFTYKEARDIVDVIVASCIEGLKRDQVLETPLGTFSVISSPPPRPWDQGDRTVTINQAPKRIFFKESVDLRRPIVRRWMREGKAEMNETVKDDSQDLAWCKRCGSNWLMEAEYRQYVGDVYSSTPGGDIQRANDAVYRLRVCLCGNLILPKLRSVPHRTPLGVESFLACATKADDYRRRAEDLDAAAEKLAAGLATTEDSDNLLHRIEQTEEMQKMLNRSPRRP